MALLLLQRRSPESPASASRTPASLLLSWSLFCPRDRCQGQATYRRRGSFWLMGSAVSVRGAGPCPWPVASQCAVVGARGQGRGLLTVSMEKKRRGLGSLQGRPGPDFPPLGHPEGHTSSHCHQGGARPSTRALGDSGSKLQHTPFPSHLDALGSPHKDPEGAGPTRWFSSSPSQHPARSDAQATGLGTRTGCPHTCGRRWPGSS